MTRRKLPFAYPFGLSVRLRLDSAMPPTTSWWERAVDGFIHAELLFIKLPFLFLNPWASRCTQWADAAEQVRVRDQPARLMTAS